MSKSTFFSQNQHICIKGKLLNLSKPLVMGILNYTPDSFYDGGKYTSEESIIKHLEKMHTEGADIIDVGVMSTRPGAIEINESEELARISFVLQLVKKHFPETVISVDTYRSVVAEHAINLGADIINDISGGQFDDNMYEVVAKYKVPYVLMHTQNKPDIMQEKPEYNNIVHDLLLYFAKKIDKLRHRGVHDIIIDVGFGFGKTLEQNYVLLNHLDLFKMLELPILVGVSRKSMIWKLLNCSPTEALNGTTALHILALEKGAKVLRVHDVKEAKEAIAIHEFYKNVN